MKLDLLLLLAEEIEAEIEAAKIKLQAAQAELFGCESRLEHIKKQISALQKGS
jgi:hypothetical protein